MKKGEAMPYDPVTYYYALDLRTELRNSPTLNGEHMARLDELLVEQTRYHGRESDATVRKRVMYCAGLARPLLVLYRTGGTGVLSDVGIIGQRETLELQPESINLCFVDLLREEEERLHVDYTEHRITSGRGADQMHSMRLRRRTDMLGWAETLLVKARAYELCGDLSAARDVAGAFLHLVKSTSQGVSLLMAFYDKLAEVKDDGTL